MVKIIYYIVSVNIKLNLPTCEKDFLLKKILISGKDINMSRQMILMTWQDSSPSW